MANKNYSEFDVVQQLSRKHDLKIQGRQIMELFGPAAKGDVGIRARGKIDFLLHYHNYTHFYVDKFK